MPNFTEGEWKSEDGFIWAHKNGMVKMVADFIPVEADSRLMAQSKNMYNILKDTLMILRDLAPCAPCNNESCSHLDCSIVRNIETILSEIDKE